MTQSDTHNNQGTEAASALLKLSAERVETDPLTNSVFDLALKNFSDILADKAALERMETTIDDVHLKLAKERAAKIQHLHFPETSYKESLNSALDALAVKGWLDFKTTLEKTTGGFVFTAHPTFALPLETRVALAEYSESPSDKTLETLTTTTKIDARAWSDSISLKGEHDETQTALRNAQSAMRAYIEMVYAVARAHFPENWRDLRPAVPSLASWVGYDLDGRTDIDWWQSMALRLTEKAEQLARYATRLEALAALPDLAAKLHRASALSAKTATYFEEDLSDPDKLLVAAKFLTNDHPDRIISADIIIAQILAEVKGADDTKATALLTLATEVEALQLGTARIHLRVNAAQVRAVIMRDLGLETSDNDLGRLVLQKLSDRAEGIKERPANFAELFLEKSTARRQIMMCAIWLQHIDAGSPIRFLIAEAENPATVMGVLYMAKQFGIDKSLDISPLFETPDALETGGRFIERLLEEPEYLAYIRTRGQLSIQLGFSDAGRFIGQIAANMAIERIHNLIANALYDVDPTISLLIFNTHGESMGRGAYPGSFADRFEHCITCWTRSRARSRNQHFIHEISFQGGDGFLHFASEGLASTTFMAWCHHHLTAFEDCSADPFYQDTDFTWDIYRRLRYWQTTLFADKDYGFLLNNFATQFLVRAGSRQRRRSGNAGGPRALRAISHNATLQQLGVPVNTASGLGSALRLETERLIGLLNRSTRMRHLMNLALKARLRTSLPVLRGYAQVYDPATWTAIARHTRSDEGGACERVYRAFRGGEVANSLNNMASHYSFDLMKFDRILAALDDAPSTEQRHDGRMNIHILHGLRQALMMYALYLAGCLPFLSGRHDASRSDFMELVTQMRLDEAQALLSEIFPTSSPELEKLSSIAGDEGVQLEMGYDKLNADIIAPLGEVQKLMHKITLALAHAYGAYG